MKNVLLGFLFLVFTFQANAQSDQLEWFTNIELAKEHAEANNKNILMVFSGSDWCKPCIQFKKEILEANGFQDWGNDKLVVLYLDFPARKKNKLSKEATLHNEALADRFNKSGLFPNIFLIDTEEKILSNPKFKNQSIEEFTKGLLMQD